MAPAKKNTFSRRQLKENLLAEWEIPCVVAIKIVPIEKQIETDPLLLKLRIFS